MRRKNDKLINVLMAVCIAVAACCLGYLGYKAWTYYTENKAYDLLKYDYVSEKPLSDDSDDTVNGADGTSGGTTPADLYYGMGGIDHDGLNMLNSDYVGWFYFRFNSENDAISYPVMYGEQYIYETITGESTSSGSLFIDENSSDDFSDLVTIVYGHNMYDRSMFGSLKVIANDPDKLEIPYFFIEREDGTLLTYEVFAIAKTKTGSSLYNEPDNEEEYDEYIDLIASQALYLNITDEVLEQEPIVALSTCYGSAGTSNRIIVYGVLCGVGQP